MSADTTKPYRLLYLSAIATAVIGMTIACDLHADDSTATRKIKLEHFKASPKTLGVKTGGTVEWFNQDGLTHSVELEGQTLQRMPANSSFRYQFNVPGTYSYQCGIHGSMRGQIVVADSIPAATSHSNYRDGMSSATARSKPSNTVKPHRAAHTELGAQQQYNDPAPYQLQPEAIERRSATPPKAYPGPTSPAATPAPAKNQGVVKIVDFMRFEPTVISVKAGSTIRWENEDGSNHMILIDGKKGPRIRHGGHYETVLTTPGEHDYICAMHGKKMSGKIIVTP
ncbi:hypothetical protein HCU74_16395 [Spongiibacter sp. KMU-166]|uniref:EfeO-type cupredoxin-like domain-containing protein n=1 Tax=Spongiibacter thalassae TaxID=2721624 RepID=A0ABX1GID4_9GAMM|nr:cupredoxin domain-containing protein [Spongiibacter thalassae]NKI18989.1 hypothetical protein [Spongiibacter thalassae]